MLKALRGCVAIVSVVRQHLEDEILSVGTHMRNELRNSDEFLRGEFQFHVRRVLLELVKELLGWSTKDVVDFVNLV